jgi:DNA polymerase III subunit epsilon
MTLVGWHLRRMVAFDLETTSLEPTEARIVSAAVLFVGGGQPTEARRWLVDPGVDIPDEAAAIHGITTAIAKAHGADPVIATAEIIASLDLLPDAPLVAYNASYDLTVLDREARRHGLAPLGPHRVIDPFVIDKAIDPYRKGSRKLADVAAHYRVNLTAEEAHAAEADAITAARLAYRLGCLGPIGGRSLADLHAAQIRWRADQARSLAEYDARRGVSRAIRGEWPIVPFVAGAVA